MKRGAAFVPLAALLLAAGCVDTTHDDAVDALGDETPGGPSELHRPGQPCVTCHGSEGPADSEFSLAGTVYALRGAEDPAPGAIVQVQDQTGQIYTVNANAAGNFWIPADAWDPVFPLQPRVEYLGIKKQMTIAVNRAASCGDCHLPSAPSRISPGRVYIATNRNDLTKPRQP
jgi:hypothetical protein